MKRSEIKKQIMWKWVCPECKHESIEEFEPEESADCEACQESFEIEEK